ncbi:MAG TPA: hypothetical protein PK198_21560, partial [Saprospiraceae bacterium]|nr:hypothetical protein [Saprospiraceae bacterium]
NRAMARCKLQAALSTAYLIPHTAYRTFALSTAHRELPTAYRPNRAQCYGIRRKFKPNGYICTSVVFLIHPTIAMPNLAEIIQQQATS